MGKVFTEASNHHGTSFVEIYQNCNIYNDGAFSELTEKDTKAESQLVLEHGKPMVFGINKNKGLVLEGSNFKVVQLGTNHTQDDILKHNIEDKNLAMLLSEITYIQELPVPIGIIYKEKKATYEEMMSNQIKDAVKSQGRGDLKKILLGSNYWNVD